MRNYNIIPILFLFLLISCGEKQENTQAPPPQFSVVTIASQDITGFQYLPVSIEGVENIDIRPRIEGFIQAIYVDEGQQVKKGDRLFKLETESLNEEANAAKSAIDVAKAQVIAAEVEVQKLIPLVEKDIISPKELETAKANLAAAESQLVQASSSYRSVQENVNYQNVTSPVDGVVGRINYRQGSLVGRTEVEPLTTVSNVTNVYGYFSLNEKNYFQFLDETEGNTLEEKIKNFPEITLVLANESEYKHKGKIQTTTGQIDSETGAISFRAIFPNPDRYLTNGNSGQVKVPTTYRNALIAPATATFETQGVTHVYKLGADSALVSTSITLQSTVDNLVVLESGLTAGDRIIAAGISNARHGIKVVPQEMPLDSVLSSYNQVFKQ